MAVSVKQGSRKQDFAGSANAGVMKEAKTDPKQEDQTPKKNNKNQKTKGVGKSAKDNLTKQKKNQTESEENKNVQTPEPNPAVTELLNRNAANTEPQAEPSNQDESGEEKSADSPQAEPETEPSMQENSGEGQSTGSTQTEPETPKQEETPKEDPKPKNSDKKNPPKKKQDPEPFPVLMKKKKQRGKSISIYFSKEAADYLEKIAEQDYSISNIVNYIVLKHIHEEEEKKKTK